MGNLIWAGSLGSKLTQQCSLVDARGQDVGGGSAVDAAEVKLVGVGLLEGLAHKVGLRAALPGEVWRWREVNALHTRTDEGARGRKQRVSTHTHTHTIQIITYTQRHPRNSNTASGRDRGGEN